MTNHEATDVLKVLKAVCEETFGEGEVEALQMAIKSLEQHEVTNDDFEKQIHAMFDHIWDCEIDHPIFHDTVGDLMDAVIQCHADMRGDRA